MIVTKNTYVKYPGDKHYKRLYPSGKKRYDLVFKHSTLDEVVSVQRRFEQKRNLVSIGYSNFGSKRTCITKSKDGTLVKTVIQERIK